MLLFKKHTHTRDRYLINSSVLIANRSGTSGGWASCVSEVKGEFGALPPLFLSSL